jgi:squalene-hopene/tetraprenyl-beta-curcumene cyclase
MKICLVFFVSMICFSVSAAAETELITLENVPPEINIYSDEPIRNHFSAELAARYLDTASLNWRKKRKCAACHTDMAYLMARPALTKVLKDSGEVRKSFEDLGKKKASGYKPVVVGVALAFNDAQTSGKLSEVTSALSRIN